MPTLASDCNYRYADLAATLHAFAVDHPRLNRFHALSDQASPKPRR